MIYATNHIAIQSRGIPLFGNDDFRVVWCKNCHHQYLYDHEAVRVFLDPEDSSKSFSDLKGETLPPCGGCNDSGWSFEDINYSERDEIKRGPWGWALDG
jgi:hypothetical protein